MRGLWYKLKCCNAPPSLGISFLTIQFFFSTLQGLFLGFVLLIDEPRLLLGVLQIYVPSCVTPIMFL